MSSPRLAAWRLASPVHRRHRRAMTLPSELAQPDQAPAHPPLQRPMLTLSDAAAACSVSRSTIRRRREDGAFPNAVQDEAGAWRIPVDDLLAAGLHLSRMGAPNEAAGQGRSVPAGHAADQGNETDEQGGPVSVLHARVGALELELAVERERRLAAERLAAERAARVEDLRTSLRMLDVGWTPPQPAPAAAPTPAEPPREGWWERRRRRRDGQVNGDVTTVDLHEQGAEQGQPVG